MGLTEGAETAIGDRAGHNGLTSPVPRDVMTEAESPPKWCHLLSNGEEDKYGGI